jgi:hypothetical protein
MRKITGVELEPILPLSDFIIDNEFLELLCSAGTVPTLQNTVIKLNYKSHLKDYCHFRMVI